MTDHVPQPRARVRLRRRLLATGAAAALAAAMLTVHGSGANATEDPLAQIDSGVLADIAANGTAEFFVYLDERPDLTPAATLSNRTSRAQFVYDELTTTAAESQAGIRAVLEARGADFTSFWITNAILVQGDEALLEELATHPDVTSIGPNETVPLIEPVASAPDDNRIQAVEWGVANINADDVWANFGVTGEGIVVANIDTGVQYNHPALVNQYRGNLGGGNFDHNYNWWDPSSICSPGVPCDNHGHGTHTMGTMVGDDGGSNQIGVAPGAQWIAMKGCEVSSCSSSALLSSGQFAVAPTDLNGNNPDPSKAPHIVNNSWGGGGGDNWYMNTVDAWVNAGIFPMFSNGNSGPSCGTAGSPGDYPQSYGVGAYDINNNIASFSSRGPSAFGGIKPNISAPGVSVRSSLPTNSYGLFSGTSMASPHASGTVALVWSAEPSLVGDISGTRSVLDTTARDVNDTQCGGTSGNNNVWGEGRIDAFAAVDAATGGDPPPPPPDLVADFTASCVKQGGTRTCTFDASSSVGDIVSWDWDFDDGGATGSGEVVVHAYQGGKARNVTLTVTDVDNNTDSVTMTVSP